MEAPIAGHEGSVTSLDLRACYEDKIDGNWAAVHASARLAYHISFYSPLEKAIAEALGKNDGLGNARTAVTW